MASRRARRRAGSPRGSSTGVWLGRLVIGLFVLGILLVPGGYIWLKTYLRSEGFRVMVNEKVSGVLEAEAAFDKFKWDGMEVTAPAFIAEGPDLIRRIEADELKAEVRFRPLLGKRVETDSVELGRLHVEIDTTRDGPQFEEKRQQAVKFENARIDELSGVVNLGEAALRWSGIRGLVSPGRAGAPMRGVLLVGSYSLHLRFSRHWISSRRICVIRTTESLSSRADHGRFSPRDNWRPEGPLISGLVTLTLRVNSGTSSVMR